MPSRWPTRTRLLTAYAIQPLVVGLVGFGLAYATGGVEAVRFWLLAIPVSIGAVAWLAISWLAIFIGTAGFVSLIFVPFYLGETLSSWAWRGQHDMDGLVRRIGVSSWIALRMLESLVATAAQHSASAPANVPFADSGWGTVGVGMLGLAGLLAAGLAGGRLRDAVLPPRLPVVHREDEPVPDEYWSPEVIIAWRAWTWDGTVLKGVWHDWPTTRFEAECEKCSEVPSWNHHCGVYALKDQSDLSSHIVHHPGVYVFGRVELSGAVIEHQSGYRAGKAEIVELFAPRGAVEAIERRYPSVPVLVATRRLI